jgi:hypothetical protein
MKQVPDGLAPDVPEQASGVRGRLRPALQLATLVVLSLAVPSAVRLANAGRGRAVEAAPSYLPALEGPRVREAFDPTPIGDLARLNPGYVVIGDSMAGSRIDPKRLGELTGRPIAPMLHAGSGSAWWYLVLKNLVIPSHVHPRAVLIFFRDANLTSVMFRLDEDYRWVIDYVAQEREDELNGVIASAIEGPWYRVARTVATVYGADAARKWIEPALTEQVGRTVVPSHRRRVEFMTNMNARFGLDHLRPMDAADLQAAEDRDADFPRFVNRSVLPLMLRDARAAGLTLCFVRVQRRPVGGRPPYQSPALRRYVRDLKNYIEANGAIFHDDTGDPALTLDMYEDGDHLNRLAKRLYTEILYERLPAVFR